MFIRQGVRMSTQNATEKQVQALKNFGVTPPTTKSACKNLLTWILQDQHGKGSRVALLKTTQEKYNGKRVSLRGGKRFGTVRHVLNNQMADYRREISGKSHGPLDAMVEWEVPIGEKKSVTRIVLSALTVL